MDPLRLVPLALLVLVIAPPPASAHAAPAPPEWFKRMMHDCNDDWGGHGAANDGHDLIALDVTRKLPPGQAEELLVLRLFMSGGYADQSSQGGALTEHVRFSIGTKTFTTEIKTTDNARFSANAGSGLTVPAYVGPKQSTGDGTRFTLELGYRPADLGVAPGQSLGGISVQALARTTKGDYMPGGFNDPSTNQYVAECPLNGTRDQPVDLEEYFVASPYTIPGPGEAFMRLAWDPLVIRGARGSNATLSITVDSVLPTRGQRLLTIPSAAPGWTVHVAPTTNESLPAKGKVELQIHIGPAIGAAEGTLELEVRTDLGGQRKIAVPLMVEAAPTSPTTATTNPSTSPSAADGNGIPGVAGEATMLALAALAFLVRRRA